MASIHNFGNSRVIAIITAYFDRSIIWIFHLLQKCIILFSEIYKGIFLNTMFHAPMGRIQLESIIILPIFPPSSHPTVVSFFPVGISSLIHFQQVLWVFKFLLSPDLGRRQSQETEEILKPIRPVENVVLTTKGLQERNTQLLDGMTVEK